MPESPIDVAGAFVKAINQENLTALRATMTEDHTFTDSRGNSFFGAEKMIAGWKYFFHSYPGYWIRVDSAFVDGDSRGAVRRGRRELQSRGSGAAGKLERNSGVAGRGGRRQGEEVERVLRYRLGYPTCAGCAIL
jgi:ketosteroid isomerase-like protein